MTSIKTKCNSKDILDRAKLVLKIEFEEIQAVSEKLDGGFVGAIELILSSNGRVIVTGMGKSGHIGKKISATLASTGTSSTFLHPAEAHHGDLGVVQKDDVILAISYSGETDEVCSLVPHFKRIGTPMIAITGDPNSTLARLAYSHINASVKLEACSLNLAPTASTTVALALGDALAVVLLEMRGFKANDFALTHPAGSLGRRLFVKVEDLMRTGKNLPSVGPEKSVAEAVLEMSAKRMGMTCVTNKDEEILGILTDGDLRRIISRGTDIHKKLVSEVMSKKALTIENNSLASEAALKMEKEKINHLLVVNGRGKLIGALGIHDLLEAKIL